jgi:hypothetical protein
MKTCSKCGAEKPATDEFFRHEKRAHGPQLRAQCRRCDVADQLRRDATRVIDPKARAQWTRHYYEAHPEMMAEKRARYRDAHPDRNRAVSSLGSAVRRGKVSKPIHCERCGSDRPLQGHHEDYTRPLDVEWLCSSCHVRHHIHVRQEMTG